MSDKAVISNRRDPDLQPGAFMRNVKRYFQLGDTCFLTLVTYQRKPILIDNVELIKSAFTKIKSRDQVKLIAWTILPDHLHLLLNSDKSNMSDVIHRLKLSFSASYRHKHGLKSGRIWHNRFWDHIIRDEMDLMRHLDYIHYNPVKHGYVKFASKHQHSSLRNLIKRGLYTADWGTRSAPDIDGEFGE